MHSSYGNFLYLCVEIQIDQIKNQTNIKHLLTITMSKSSLRQDFGAWKKSGGVLNKVLFFSLAVLGTAVGVKYSGLVDSGDSNNSSNIVEVIKKKVTTTFKAKSSLSRFTGFWIPIDLMGKYRPSEYILGLVYLEDDNVIGEFEGPAENYAVKSRWIEIKEFDYDEDTGVLTIDFAKNNPEKGQGTATFQIDDNDHLFMTNPGGTFEFFRGNEENMKENYKLLQEEYERKARNRPIQQDPYYISPVIPKGDTRGD